MAREVDTEFCCGDPCETVHLEDPSVDGKIIISWIYKKLDGGHRIDLSGSG